MWELQRAMKKKTYKKALHLGFASFCLTFCPQRKSWGGGRGVKIERERV